MEIDYTAIKYIAYTGLLAVTIMAQHMGFRTPNWQRREYARRAIGSTTVLLYALLFVLDGAADLRTWVIVVGGFIVATVVKLGMVWKDNQRRNELLRGNEGED